MGIKALNDTSNFRFLNILFILQEVLNDLQRTRLYCGSVIRLLAHSLPHPFPISKASLFFQSSCVSPVELTDRGVRGAKSYDREKAWHSINYSLFSAVQYNNLQELFNTTLTI
jgi:hypothetical protein